MKRMSLRKFGKIVARIMKSLPREFKPYLRNLVVDVELEPDLEMLRRSGYTEEEIAAGETLLGLFAPLGSPPEVDKDDESDIPYGEFQFDTLDEPHRLIIYKRPHEDAFSDPQEFLIEVRKTVIHELAHHFGLDGRDLARFEDNPNPFSDDLKLDD
jgi:predicted Zn-dependent protease with MMP-like domain